MDFSPDSFLQLWEKLVWPLVRLIGFISIGLLVANIIESFQWTSKLVLLSRPLIKLGHMSEIVGASFSMALFSGVSANTMLAEAFEKQQISKKELILANLFNSLPTYFLHLPTIFFITLPLIKGAAFIYVGLTLGAALLRTCAIVLISRSLLPKRLVDLGEAIVSPTSEKADWRVTWKKIAKRFKKRMKKIIKFTIPIYILIFCMHRIGIFREFEQFMGTYLAFIPWLTPQSMGIITLHLAAELTAGLAAAGALLQEGSMSIREVVIALMIGNIISSPVRAIRHQFPYYAGIFEPKVATQLIICSQTFRVGSLIVMGIFYILISS